MKTHRIALILAALIGLAAGSRVVGAESKWTPAEQEVVAVIDAWAAAFESGAVDRILSHTAPAFSCWEFSKPRWKTRAEYRESEAAFYRTNRVTGCELPPELIEIDGDTAAVQGRHTIHVEATSGAKRTLQGSWSASLIRRNRQWMFLNLAWIDDRPATDAAAIKAEVSKAFDAFKVAVEKADLPAALAVVADVPEFRYTTSEGAVLDDAAWKQGHTEHFATVAAHRFFPKDQQITVLGPDAALVNWAGAMEIVPKEGALLRVDPFSASFLFKRISGAWKLVQQQESCPPPQPVAAPVTSAAAEAELRAADAELVAAANARELDRWLACFEAEAMLVPPGATPIAGLTAIRPAASELMKCPDFAVAHAITHVEALPGGRSATVAYDFTFTANGEDGRKVTETGTDTTLYRKGPDGRWRVLVDVWNPDEPTAVDATPAVLALLDDAFAAVNALDAERFLGFFVPDENLTVFEDRDLRSTRKEFAAFLTEFFSGVSAFRVAWEQRTVRELAPDVALVTGTFTGEGKDKQGAPFALRMAATWVLVKRGDRWLIQHVHESSLNSPP